MEDDLDLFDDDGHFQQPTMRGNANLDIQDYQGGPEGGDLLDELQEDVPSTPGSGAGPAPDIDGTSEYELLSDEYERGMTQTTYGSSPWGPGSGTGYQPMSMRATDLSGNEEAVRPAPRDPQMNREPSNRGVDPLTLYDRESFEYNDSEQDTVGTGIFDTEEGVTFRARDGAFAHQYAMPSYIVDEDELGIQQSDMWDVVAENWRVVQPSAGGVALSRKVEQLKPAYSPFAQNGMRPMPEMRPEMTGPRSHVEAFGRKVAAIVIDEAQKTAPAARGSFLTAATEALGPKMSARCKETADRLVGSGFKPEVALEDALAHCVMHACVEDLTKGKGDLPRLDKLAAVVRQNGRELRGVAQQHVAPLLADGRKLRSDLGALFNSNAAAGMGEVSQPSPEATPTPSIVSTVLTGRNLLIGAAAVGVGYLFVAHTSAGQSMQKNVTRNARKAWRKVRRAARGR